MGQSKIKCNYKEKICHWNTHDTVHEGGKKERACMTGPKTGNIIPQSFMYAKCQVLTYMHSKIIPAAWYSSCKNRGLWGRAHKYVHPKSKSSVTYRPGSHKISLFHQTPSICNEGRRVVSLSSNYNQEENDIQFFRRTFKGLKNF